MTRTRKILSTLILSSMLTINSLPTFAETADTTQATTTTDISTSVSPTTEATTPNVTTPSATITTKDQNLADALSKTYGFTVNAQDVADQHATGFGYGEISKAYGFAALSGKQVGEITGMKQTMGWGEIAESLGIKVSDVTRSDNAVQKSISKKDSRQQSPKTSTISATSSTKGASSGNSHGGNSGGHGGGHGK